jgi:hypothetical protein
MTGQLHLAGFWSECSKICLTIVLLWSIIDTGSEMDRW